MSLEIFYEDTVLVDRLISTFLDLCSKINELNITAKFHHLIHYPIMIRRFGHPRIFSTINFESFHSFLNTKIKTSKNRNAIEI